MIVDLDRIRTLSSENTSEVSIASQLDLAIYRARRARQNAVYLECAAWFSALALAIAFLLIRAVPKWIRIGVAALVMLLFLRSCIFVPIS